MGCCESNFAQLMLPELLRKMLFLVPLFYKQGKLREENSLASSEQMSGEAVSPNPAPFSNGFVIDSLWIVWYVAYPSGTANWTVLR